MVFGWAARAILNAGVDAGQSMHFWSRSCDRPAFYPLTSACVSPRIRFPSPTQKAKNQRFSWQKCTGVFMNKGRLRNTPGVFPPRTSSPVPLHPPLPERLSPVENPEDPVVRDVFCPVLRCHPEGERLHGDDVPARHPARVPWCTAVNVPDLGIGKGIPGVVEELEEDFPAPHHGCFPEGMNGYRPRRPAGVRSAVPLHPEHNITPSPVIPCCTGPQGLHRVFVVKNGKGLPRPWFRLRLCPGYSGMNSRIPCVRTTRQSTRIQTFQRYSSAIIPTFPRPYASKTGRGRASLASQLSEKT